MGVVGLKRVVEWGKIAKLGGTRQRGVIAKSLAAKICGVESVARGALEEHGDEVISVMRCCSRWNVDRLRRGRRRVTQKTVASGEMAYFVLG